MTPRLPLLGITMGDPAGVGPEITARALATPEVGSTCRPMVIGDRSVMDATLALLRSPLKLHAVSQPADCRFEPGTLECLDLANVDASTLPRAQVSAGAGRAAYAYIERAVRLCQSGEIDGMVTAPVNKEALAAAGVQHSGHTEILAKLSGTKDFAMLLMGRELKVIHVTTHVALRRVPDLCTEDRVLRVIRLAQQTMNGLGVARPRIAVCGLNPHAGEDGLFGDEEKTQIIPATEAARREGLDVYGPLPADTLFSRARGGEFDIVVAMYHDQGHVPVKTLGFTYDEARGQWTGLSGVNVTVGLPFLRVSVDHGTAFDRAWKGIANPESMLEAIDVAIRMLSPVPTSIAHYRIAEIGGDGIGPEVVAEAVRVLEAAQGDSLHFSFERGEVGAALYRRTGEDLPRDTVDLCRSADAILFGAAGLPDIRHADGTELVPQITLRMMLDLYAGMRPIKLYPGVRSPLALPGGATIDYVIFRENTEGLFASLGGGSKVGEELAVDTLVITRKGTERIVRRAFETCQARADRTGGAVSKVTCVDKANVFRSYAFFRQVFQETARTFRGVKTDFAYIDAMTMYVVQAPWRHDVIVLENMFGDILSDLGAATVGGLGMAPSGDIGDRWALFQPSHGTAPDIAGKGIANPMATILSAAMMCRWLGAQHTDARVAAVGDRIEAAVAKALQDPKARTRDLGGEASTRAAGEAVIKAL